MHEPSVQSKLDWAIDFSLGLLSKEEESALLSEARKDPELEAMMRQQCACQERARAEGFSSANHSPGPSSADTSRGVWTRGRLAIAGSALAASVALILWMQSETSPELYWLPVDGVLSTQRSAGADSDEFRTAVESYTARDLDAVITVLERKNVQGSAADLRNLYLASSLLNLNRGAEAASVLGTIDIESLPHPWRGYGQELERRIRDAFDE